MGERCAENFAIGNTTVIILTFGMTDSKEEKPAVEKKPSLIVTLKHQDGVSTPFKVKYNTKMQKVRFEKRKY